MPNKITLSPETTNEIISLADAMMNRFAQPEFIPGCEVKSIADVDEYDTNNGWIEAVCGKHNQQRCRWKGKYSNVQVGDYVDVLYFKSLRIFEVFGRGGTGTMPLGGWPFENVLTVSATDPDANYSTITTAIAGASTGDIIWIDGGTYSEQVTLNKKVYLIGSSREGVIITHNASPTITSTTADCVIENVTIKNTTAGSSPVFGFNAGADVIIKNVTFDCTGITTTGGAVGIYNAGAYTVDVDDCKIIVDDGSSSSTIGVYANHASAIINVIGGYIDAQTSGGNSYDVVADTSGTVNLRKPYLENGTFYGGTGTYTGDYINASGDFIQPGIGNDTYPDNDVYGLWGRLVNYGRTPEEHWHQNTDEISWTGYAAYTGYSTPSIITIEDSFYKMANAGATKAFRYRAAATSAAIFLYCRIAITYVTSAGLMIDDGSDTGDGDGANNFYRAYITQSTVGGAINAVEQYRTGGGAVTTNTTTFTLVPNIFYGLGIKTGGTLWTSWVPAPTIFGEGQTLVQYTNGGGTQTWTPARVGLYWVGTAVDGGRKGIWDWYDEDTS